MFSLLFLALYMNNLNQESVEIEMTSQLTVIMPNKEPNEFLPVRTIQR